MLSENIIPKDAFKGAKAVLLLQAAYAAAGVTAFCGQGFIVAAVKGQWSAPSFLSLSSVGVGLSLGGEDSASLASFRASHSCHGIHHPGNLCELKGQERFCAGR